MTRRSIESSSSHSSPMQDENGLISSPPPPPPPTTSQTLSSQRSPLQVMPNSPPMLATMTPVNVMDLKKEVDEESAIGRNSSYSQVKSEVLYDKEGGEIYSSQNMEDKSDTPIDLIYEDGSKTVIYTTTPDQKGLEIYSADNSGEITINNISAHQIQASQQIRDVLVDENSGNIVNSNSRVGAPPGTVSVVLQGNGQGLLQYPHQAQVPGATVLVLSELVEDVGVPVVGLTR